MAASVQSIDEQIMYMVDMGFDIDDCQAAVQNGKLSVDEAIEWILSGKPQMSSLTSPTLKLKLTQNSEMDASNVLSGLTPAADVATPMDTETNAVDLASSVDVTSRLSMSDEQRQSRQRFEEKQREEAKRLAQADKLAKRRAHAEALKQIQEDREKQKERTVVINTTDNCTSFGSISSNSVANSSVSQNTILQIRLPEGRCVKQTFTADSNLLVVKQFIDHQLTNCSTEYSLIQPFPRVEFGVSEMDRTLKELGLAPTGSLVVNVKVLDQRTTAAELEAGHVRTSPLHTASPDAASFRQWGGQPAHSHDHQWGTGHQLVADDCTIADNAGDASESVSDNAEGDILPVQPQLLPDVAEAQGPGGPGGHVPGGWGGNVPGGPGGHVPGGWGGNVPGGPGGHVPGGWGGNVPGGPGGLLGLAGAQPLWGGGFGGHNQHNWGVGGQRLAGEILENVVLAHHSQHPKELAAEAASKRYSSPPASSVASNANETAPPLVDIPMLRDVVVKYITGRICSTRYPITGLQCLPAPLANRIVDYLIKEGLLRPKTLQVFNSCRLQEIVLDCYSYCTNELLAVLRHQTCLKSVSLHSCPLITNHGLQYLTALKTLKHLNIGSCRQVNDNCIAVLIDLPSLVTLVIEDTAVTDAGIIQYANSAPQHLANLDLSRTNVTHNILPALHAIPHLTKLNLEHTKVAGLSGVELLSELKVLNLANTAVVTDSFLCLRLNSSLVALNIANTVNVNGDTALQYLTDLQLVDIQLPDRITTTDRGVQSISNMPLTSLDLTNYINITDKSMASVAHITTLRKLRLSNTKVTDGGILFLEGLKELRELHLDRTLITDEGILTVLRAFSHLEELNLSHTAVTNNSLLNGAINVCGELLKLNLSKTDISDKGLRHLCLPFLTMLYIDDTYVRPDKLDSLSTTCPQLEHVIYRTLRVPPPNEDL